MFSKKSLSERVDVVTWNAAFKGTCAIPISRLSSAEAEIVGGGAIAPQFHMTRNIFIKDGYFDQGSGERNMSSFSTKTSNKGQGFFKIGHKTIDYG